MHNAIIFDLDGTLLNSLADLANAVNRTLSQLGFATHDIDAYRYFIGDGARMLIARALPENERSDKRIEQCFAAFKNDYAQNWNKESKLYPGISNLLDELTQRGITMTILSNKPHVFTKKCVDHFLPQWNFEVVQGQQESIPRKPDPAAALLISQKLLIAPASFLFIGDSAVDMKTADAANMYPVGVLWGYRDAKELLSNGAKALVHSADEILAYI